MSDDYLTGSEKATSELSRRYSVDECLFGRTDCEPKAQRGSITSDGN